MIKIIYDFTFPDTNADSFKFEINLDPKTISYQSHDDPVIDEFSDGWIKLEKNQCSHCPLNPKNCQYCPVAKNLNSLIQTFKKTRSYKRSKMFVHTEDRTYVKEGPIQEGLFSIFGIIMSTSGCPHLNFLKPMTRFHLPFATNEETMYRITGSFLLRKFVEKNTKSIDSSESILDIGELLNLYKNVEIVNRDFLTRIRSFMAGEVNQNAMIVLNCFAKMVEIEVKNEFDSLYYLFKDRD